MPEEAIDISSMTPTDAGAKLAVMKAEFDASQATAAAPAGSPHAAIQQLGALQGNDAWRGKFFAGDIEARRQFAELTERIAAIPVVDLGMAGVKPIGWINTDPGAHLEDLIAAVPDLRERGLGDTAIREVLTDQKFSAQQHADASAWKQRVLKDEFFVRLYVSGDADAMRQMTVANAILASEVG